MRLLLDTHTFLWFTATPHNLSKTAFEVLNNPANEVMFSIASAWEMSIKAGLGKLGLVQKVVPFVKAQIALNGFQLLPMTLDHVDVVENLPLHLRDPFDRLLIAQVLNENIAIVSVDAALDPYGVTRIW